MTDVVKSVQVTDPDTGKVTDVTVGQMWRWSSHDSIFEIICFLENDRVEVKYNTKDYITGSILDSWYISTVIRHGVYLPLYNSPLYKAMSEADASNEEE